VPKVRGMTSVWAQSFPIVHHHIPSTNSDAGRTSTFAEPARPTVATAAPAIVPRIAPLCRTAACRTCSTAMPGSRKPYATATRKS